MDRDGVLSGFDVDDGRGFGEEMGIRGEIGYP
jgi:hypothetical protein